MQELLFPEWAKTLTDSFDDYIVKGWERTLNDRGVMYFRRTDTNGKHYYLVAERVADGDWWRLTNAKEFGHAENRALRYYDMRRNELARDA